MPTIAQLLQAHRDRTGDSYADMSKRVRGEIHLSRLQQLTAAPPKEFPKQQRTIELLAELLQVPVATIVLAFAAGLGIDVRDPDTATWRLLPPGTDRLTDQDRTAVKAVVRALVEARTQAGVPMPDLGRVEGLRLVEPETLETAEHHGNDDTP